jgi:hypothetical protein
VYLPTSGCTALATVVNLPGVDVSLTDLLVTSVRPGATLRQTSRVRRREARGRQEEPGLSPEPLMRTVAHAAHRITAGQWLRAGYDSD